MAMSALPDAQTSAARAFLHQRVLDATPTRVFAAFADPALLARWWGPAGFRSSFQTFEFRPGGAWRFVMHGPDGQDYPNESRFHTLQPDQRIVIEHLALVHHFWLDITLSAQGAQTLLQWRQVFDSAEERDALADFVGPANEQNLDRLAELLRTQG